MKHLYAAQIKPDDAVDDYFRVVELRLAPFRDERKGHYLQLVLGDRSGRVEARLWEDAQAMAEQLAAGDVVHITGRAALYQERIRLRLDSIEPAAAEDAPEPAELLAAPQADVDELLAALHAASARIVNPALRRLLESYFSDGQFVEAFCLAPVERPGDLLRQTVALLELAEPLRSLAADLDHDLLTTALLLHASGLTRAVYGGTEARTLAWLGVATASDELLIERLHQMPDFPAEVVVRLRAAMHAVTQPAHTPTREGTTLTALLALHTAALGRQQPER